MADINKLDSKTKRYVFESSFGNGLQQLLREMYKKKKTKKQVINFLKSIYGKE